MSINVKWCCVATFVALVAISFTIIFNEELLIPKKHPSKYPKPIRKYWGKDPSQQVIDDIDTSIHTFIPYEKNNEIQTKNEKNFGKYIKLWLEYEELNPFQHNNIIMDDINKIDYNKLTIIEGGGYGLNYNDFFNLISYLNEYFNWKKYKNIIQNSFNHYITKINGLNIHFIKHTLNKNKNKNEKIDAIMLLHGWPSSFWEYSKLLNMFENKYKEYEIDIIIPSLPGYGFSDYPMYHTGFDMYSIAEIFVELMETRLNYSSYITIGGDWGGGIMHNIAYYVSTNIKDDDKYIQKFKGMLITSSSAGSPPLHDILLLSLNLEFINKYLANKYNVSLNKINLVSIKSIKRIWDLVGYIHQHATRANTIGIVLETSPVAHLGWIYEKYLSWSDSFQNIKYDTQKRIISGDLSWDDIIITNNIYWYNGKISSGIRYYTECIWKAMTSMSDIYIPKEIAVGLSVFEGDPYSDMAGIFEKWTYKNIILRRFHENGGHFAALEYPQTVYDDIVEFIHRMDD